MSKPTKPRFSKRHDSYIDPDEADCYLPTREEIAAECAKIRESWSNWEHRRRAGFGIRGRLKWEVPTTHLALGPNER